MATPSSTARESGHPRVLSVAVAMAQDQNRQGDEINVETTTPTRRDCREIVDKHSNGEDLWLTLGEGQRTTNFYEEAIKTLSTPLFCTKYGFPATELFR